MRIFWRTLVAAMVSLALVPLALVTPVAAAASTFVVQAGAGSADNAAQAFQFYPSTLTIDAGDSVTWKDGSGLIHNVSFGTAPATLPPPAPVPGTSFDGTGFVSSGRIHPGAAYTLTFPKAGTYNYVCRLHQPAMKATLVVQPAGTPYPAGQSSYAPSGDPRLPAALAAGQAALAAQKVTSTAAAGGATSYAQNAGFGDGKSFGLLRFGAHQLTVHTGDTVVWTQNDPDEVHTVSFLDNGKDVDFLTDPAAHQPAGGSVYSGSGFFNSGVLMPGKSYALTFNTPGTYAYQCL
ncbi:MAG TPA: plastocyanin/azurin family copper-binding protein, partial [Chloroflexota bacterium]